MSHTTQELAVKAAAIKAVKDAAAAAEAEVKAALEGVLDPGDRKTARIDGQSAATITYTQTQATATITNRHDFQGWVQAHHPEEMVSVPVEVDPEDLRWVIGMRDNVKAYPSMPDDYNAAFDRLVKAVQGSRQMVRPTYEARVLANAKEDKAAVDRDSGEVIPGVTYRPGGGAGYITIRQDEKQKDVLTTAWQEGTIDTTTLALTPLAELETTDANA